MFHRFRAFLPSSVGCAAMLAGCAAMLAGAQQAGAAGAAEPAYAIVKRMPGPSSPWDYAVVDESSHKLYLAQGGVTALDLTTGTVSGGFVAGHSTHGLAVLSDGHVAVDDSAANTITVFDGTGHVLKTIDMRSQNTGRGEHVLDALLLEPKSGLLVAANGESGLLLLIDVQQGAVVGKIPVGGELEAGAANGKGLVYINVETKGKPEIAVIDVASRRVVSRMALPGCDGPTGLAYDQPLQLVISVCDNGTLHFLGSDGGREIVSLPVGKGADGVMLDSQRRRVFTAGAKSGTLSVVALRGVNDIALIQTLPTQRGTRLGAVDLASGNVYLPGAKFGPPKPPSPYPTVLPDSFEFLQVAAHP
jgi:DNA-binding beta-propeller fold protein YncE